MNVCLLTRYFDLTNGGIGRFSMELRKRLIDHNINVYGVSTGGDYGAQNYMKYVTWNIRKQIPKESNVYHEKFDVYHALSPMESAWIPKNRSIVTFHDFIPWLHAGEQESHYTGRGLTKRANILISKQMFHYFALQAIKSRFVVCDSESTMQELLDHTNINPDKVRVIRLGIRDDLKPKPKPDNIFRVGTLSYLDRRKRIDLLIKSFLDADIDGELVIGGQGVDEARLKELAAGDIRIKFLGFIPDDKLVDFYNSLDLFVFPTKIEGYGLPIIEAMACGKPVVVLADSIIPSEIKARCYNTSIFAAIKASAEFGVGSHQKRIENLAFAHSHTWENTAREYEKLYRII